MMQDPEYARIPVSRKAELLGVNKRGYYKWLERPTTDRNPVQEEIRVRDELLKIAIEFPRYGYRRMTIELHNRGHLVNHKRVLRLMKEDNLLCVKKQFKPLTINSNHPHKIYLNLLRYKKLIRPNQGWASYITYIHSQMTLCI